MVAMLRLMESIDVPKRDKVTSLHAALVDGTMERGCEPCRGSHFSSFEQDAKLQRMPQRGMLP